MSEQRKEWVNYGLMIMIACLATLATTWIVQTFVAPHSQIDWLAGLLGCVFSFIAVALGYGVGVNGTPSLRFDGEACAVAMFVVGLLVLVVLTLTKVWLYPDLPRAVVVFWTALAVAFVPLGHYVGRRRCLDSYVLVELILRQPCKSWLFGTR